MPERALHTILTSLLNVSGGEETNTLYEELAARIALADLTIDATGVVSATTLSLDVADFTTGVLGVARGGTALGSGTSGGVLGYTAAGTIASSAALAANQLVLGGGAGATPTTLGSLGTTTTVLHGDAAGAPTFAAVALATDVSGDLPFANLTQGSALSVLGVTGNATADVASIAAGSDAQVLRRSGTALAFGALDLAAAAAITGDLPDANLSANVPLLNAANTFTAAGNNFDEILAVDKGLQFPAVQVADAGANVLDDYEEGTWTPVIGGSGGTSGQSYTHQVGAYVKIGKKVHCQFSALLSAKGTITNDVQIQGLPFTTENTANQYSAGSIDWYTLNTAMVSMLGEIVINGTAVAVKGMTAAATSVTNITTTDLVNTSWFIGSIQYRATA